MLNNKRQIEIFAGMVYVTSFLGLSLFIKHLGLGISFFAGLPLLFIIPLASLIFYRLAGITVGALTTILLTLSAYFIIGDLYLAYILSVLYLTAPLICALLTLATNKLYSLVYYVFPLVLCVQLTVFAAISHMRLGSFSPIPLFRSLSQRLVTFFTDLPFLSPGAAEQFSKDFGGTLEIIKSNAGKIVAFSLIYFVTISLLQYIFMLIASDKLIKKAGQAAIFEENANIHPTRLVAHLYIFSYIISFFVLDDVIYTGLTAAQLLFGWAFVFTALSWTEGLLRRLKLSGFTIFLLQSLAVFGAFITIPFGMFSIHGLLVIVGLFICTNRSYSTKSDTPS